MRTEAVSNKVLRYWFRWQLQNVSKSIFGNSCKFVRGFAPNIGWRFPRLKRKFPLSFDGAGPDHCHYMSRILGELANTSRLRSLPLLLSEPTQAALRASSRHTSASTTLKHPNTPSRPPIRVFHSSTGEERTLYHVDNAPDIKQYEAMEILPGQYLVLGESTTWYTLLNYFIGRIQDQSPL